MCERHDPQPSVFYGWQRKFFENGAAAFQGDTSRQTALELILRRAKEKLPNAKPRVISDNGPQFLAYDFKAFIRLAGAAP